MRLKTVAADQLFPLAQKFLCQVNTVLDIGCGIMPQQFIRPLVHVCCEPYDEYIKHLKTKTQSDPTRDYVIINATWEKAVEIFPEKSVDSVFIIDVIEHLEKKKALKLLKKTEKIARKQIAVFTTLDFIPQSHPNGKDAWGLNGAAWQEHKSGWFPEDFGKDWEVIISKDFHKFDNLGNKYLEPKGALWAIKTFESKTDKTEVRRELFRQIHHYSVATNSPAFLKTVLTSMKFFIQLKKIIATPIIIIHGFLGNKKQEKQAK